MMALYGGPNGADEEPRSVDDRIREVARSLRREWGRDPRWEGVRRAYDAEEVVRLRGSMPVDHTLAQTTSEKLWRMISGRDYVQALGAVTGQQAVQMGKAGLDAIYVSGWQTAADANTVGETYPDQSIYPADGAPQLVDRITNALRRADQIEWSEGELTRDWHLPVVADAEAGHGGNLNTFELTKWMIRAGAAGIHYEDQLASEKKCGHMGGKVLVPTSEHERKLTAARLAADVLGVPTITIARTDALSATLITNDVDARDRPHIVDDRTPEGFYRYEGSLEAAIERSLAYAPLVDMLWFETSTPDLEEAERYADRVHAEHPGKPLMYNCSPSFHWTKHLDEDEIDHFQEQLADMGYAFQFVTLAGFHSLNASMFELAQDYAREGMRAYVDLQEREFALAEDGYTAVRHQREAGAGYFDQVSRTVTGGRSSTLALEGSTEAEQFDPTPDADPAPET
jgi:isocitrate lyase